MYNELYTGYFANIKKYEHFGYTPVSIAGITPEFFKGEKWSDFAPRKTFFSEWKKGLITDKEYMKKYLDYLSTIPKEDIEELREITKDGSFVMCCYEKPGDFCHRHYLAAFLRRAYGFKVQELRVGERWDGLCC
jgi:uncharacterized protein YeaO (DUF488 family)